MRQHGVPAGDPESLQTTDRGFSAGVRLPFWLAAAALPQPI